jgi:hypothetical protein
MVVTADCTAPRDRNGYRSSWPQFIRHKLHRLSDLRARELLGPGGDLPVPYLVVSSLPGANLWSVAVNEQQMFAVTLGQYPTNGIYEFHAFQQL